MLGTVGKPLVRRRAWAWFCGIPTYGGKVIEFQIFSVNKKNKKITFTYILPVATTHGHPSVTESILISGFAQQNRWWSI